MHDFPQICNLGANPLNISKIPIFRARLPPDMQSRGESTQNQSASEYPAAPQSAFPPQFRIPAKTSVVRPQNTLPKTTQNSFSRFFSPNPWHSSVATWLKISVEKNVIANSYKPLAMPVSVPWGIFLPTNSPEGTASIARVCKFPTKISVDKNVITGSYKPLAVPVSAPSSIFLSTNSPEGAGRGFLRTPPALSPARPCSPGLPLLLPLPPVIGRRPPLRALPDAQLLAPLSPALPSSLLPCPGGF